MKIYKTLNTGAFHHRNCEDFFAETQIGASERLIAVLDGCSAGVESVFASILFGKMLRTISKKELQSETERKAPLTLKRKLKVVVEQLLNEVKRTKHQHGLDTSELLSTLIIGIIDTQEKRAEFLTLGDGLICKDGEIIEYDQDNKPDYFAYHLEDDFDDWYAFQPLLQC